MLQMEPDLRKIFGPKRKRFSLEAEHANFDFRGGQEHGERSFITTGHGVYGRAFIYLLPFIIIFALIFI